MEDLENSDDLFELVLACRALLSHLRAMGTLVCCPSRWARFRSSLPVLVRSKLLVRGLLMQMKNEKNEKYPRSPLVAPLRWVQAHAPRLLLRLVVWGMAASPALDVPPFASSWWHRSARGLHPHAPCFAVMEGMAVSAAHDVPPVASVCAVPSRLVNAAATPGRRTCSSRPAPYSLGLGPVPT